MVSGPNYRPVLIRVYAPEEPCQNRRIGQGRGVERGCMEYEAPRLYKRSRHVDRCITATISQQ
jgi:hypothetical protein